LSFIDRIRSKAAPPPPFCSSGEVGPSYAGAGSTEVSVARIVGTADVVLPFLGHCLDMWPCAQQLKQRHSLSNVFHSSLVRNAAQLYCPCGCCVPFLLLPAVLTASTSIALSFRRQLFPLPFKACSHLFRLSFRRNRLANIALFSTYAAWCTLAA
jgi:hypothetical protein